MTEDFPEFIHVYAANPHRAGFGDTSSKKLSFSELIEVQRRMRGLTQQQAADLVPISVSTWERWISGKVVPSKAVQRAALLAIEGATAAPSKRKLAAVQRSHHLFWEKHKGWILRVTIDRGSKMKGTRVKFYLNTHVMEHALERRSVVLMTCRRLGLKIKPRIQKRHGPKNGASSAD